MDGANTMTPTTSLITPRVDSGAELPAHERHRLQEIESLLQDKLVQHTTRDSDKFRQILRLFQSQVARNPTQTTAQSNSTLGISPDNFESVLKLLDVWTTRDQAQQLFNKYDANGDGRLTAYEFITRCRPVDYDVSVESWNREPVRREGGKKIFTHSGNTPIIPPTPSPRLSLGKIAQDVRLKMKQQHPGRQSNTSSRAKLTQYFQYFDKHRQGAVTPQEMKRVLDHVNLNIGDENTAGLYSQFQKNGEFDYKSFSEFIYPPHADATLSTSLEIGNDFYERNSRDREAFERSNQSFANSFRRLRPPAPHTARPSTGSGSAAFRAYSMQRPGMMLPQSARGHRSSRGSLPPMHIDGKQRPPSVMMQRPSSQQQLRADTPQFYKSSASTGDLVRSRPGTANRYVNSRPASRAEFMGGADVSPIPSQEQKWERPHTGRPQTGNQRPKTAARPPSAAMPHRPPSRVEVMGNPLHDGKSPYDGADPMASFIGIPAVRVPTKVRPIGKLRKVRKVKGKKNRGGYGKLGVAGRPRPPLGAADYRFVSNPYLQSTLQKV
jgi:Ca2+-binding EF-hand superfamily protein